MYAFVEGKIDTVNPAIAVINCQGIGFQINISLNTYAKIKDLGNCRLYTHQVVREDAILLYGFFNLEEKNIFTQLISVSGVGPNTARLILSSLSTHEVVEAISTGNISVLQRVKGIGGKSASRIIVDLKDKMTKDNDFEEILSSSHNTGKQEALSALVMLGFNKVQAEKAIEQVIKSEGNALPVDKIIKSALKIL